MKALLTQLKEVRAGMQTLATQSIVAIINRRLYSLMDKAALDDKPYTKEMAHKALGPIINQARMDMEEAKSSRYPRVRQTSPSTATCFNFGLIQTFSGLSS